MQKQLKDLHENMIELFAESDRELAFVNNRKNFNQKVARATGVLKQFKDYLIAHSVNKNSSTEEQNKERQKMINEEFEVLKENMKEIGFDENSDEFKTVCEIHDNFQNVHDYQMKLFVVGESFKNKGQAILNSSVDKKINQFTKGYQDLITDFKDSGGKGWYDFMGEYNFNNSLNQKRQFVSALEEMKASGVDIEIMVNFEKTGVKEGVVTLLTNSANVEKIHDVIYQDLNPKNVIIDGSVMLPKFKQNPNMDFLENSRKIDDINDYNAFMKSGEKKKSMPKELEQQYYSKGDAFAISKGKPINALFCSRLSDEFVSQNLVRNKAHFYNGSPSKDATKIQNKEKEQRIRKNRM